MEEKIKEAHTLLDDNSSNPWEYDCRHCGAVKKILNKYVIPEIAELIADYGKDYMLNWSVCVWNINPAHTHYTRMWDQQCSPYSPLMPLSLRNSHPGILQYNYVLRGNIQTEAAEWGVDLYDGEVKMYNAMVRTGDWFYIRGGYIRFVKIDGALTLEVCEWPDE
jgi:hypothetical protein